MGNLLIRKGFYTFEPEIGTEKDLPLRKCFVFQNSIEHSDALK